MKQLVDVCLLDRMAAKFNFDIGNVADQASGTIACPDILDREARHAFGKLNRFANCELTRRHIRNEATLDPAALTLAGAENPQASLVILPRYHRTDLG